MFDEPLSEVCAHLALAAFPGWGEPDDGDNVADWIRRRLCRGRWSSTEWAVLHLAAGLVGIEEYDSVSYRDDGTERIERCPVPPLGHVLSAGLDADRRAHVLAAVELAVIGECSAEWYWVGRLAP